MSTVPDAPIVRRASGMQRTELVLMPGTDSDDPVTAILKHTPGGTITQTLTKVKLRDDKSETYEMSARVKRPRGQDGWEYIKIRIPTAVGYERLNQFCGVSTIQPPELVQSDGGRMPNPHIHTNEAGDIVWVDIRMVGFGRAATGDRMVVDYTLRYDLQTYFAQDAWSKWTGRKSEAPKVWGRAFPAAVDPKLEGNWHSIPVAGGLKLWLNLESQDVLGLFAEHLNRQKFAIRNAQTICRRNVLKRFIPVQRLPSDNTVPVVGWVTPDREVEQLSELASRTHKGQLTVGDDVIDVDSVAETVAEPEEVDAALTGDVDEEDAPPADAPDDETPEPSVDPAPSKPKPDDAAQLSALRAEIRQLYRQIPGDQAEQAMLDTDVASFDAIGKCKSVKALELIKTNLLKRGARPKKGVSKPVGKPPEKSEQSEQSEIPW